MKRMSIAGSLVVALLTCNGASAQEALYLGESESAWPERRAAAAYVPPEALLVELERWIWRDITFSVRPAPSYQTHPGKRQGFLGVVSSTPFPGSHPLYGCMANDYSDRFTSMDQGCEGHLPVPQIHFTGYIASTQLPGTIPLYRCMRVGGLPSGRWGDHFDTTDANCEGKRAVFNGMLGYIWR